MPKETIYPEDKDWVNYKTDLNDGWADDVPLMYDKEGFKPDDDELISVNIDDELISDNINADKTGTNKSASSDTSADSSSTDSSSTDSSSTGDSSANDSSKEQETTSSEDSLENSSENEPIKKNKSNKIKPFRMFMICWIGILLISIAILLGLFLDYLVDYQKVYEDTRPYHRIVDIVKSFNDHDYNLIYNYITVKPELTEFETEENYKNYIQTVVDNENVSFKEANNFNENFPNYYLMSDGFIVANVELRKDPTNYADYKFPIWYISSFEFYSDPQYSCTIEIPENYQLFLNGVEVNNNYAEKRNIILDEQQYYKDYLKLPTLKKIRVSGLFEAPEISVLDSQGKEVEVFFNTSRGLYEVTLGSYLDDEKDAKDFAIELISNYANYISDDAPANILSDSFIPESDMLELIQSGSSRRFFDAHSKSEIKNAKVTEFKVYNDDAVFCRVELNQILTYNTNKEYVNEVNLGVYLIRTDDGWKACTLQY